MNFYYKWRSIKIYSNKYMILLHGIKCVNFLYYYYLCIPIKKKGKADIGEKKNNTHFQVIFYIILPFAFKEL